MNVFSDVAFTYNNNEGDVMKFNMETKTAELILSSEILVNILTYNSEKKV